MQLLFLVVHVLPFLIFSMLPISTTAKPTIRSFPLTSEPRERTALSIHILTKRAKSIYLAGGWTFSLASTTAFNDVPSTASALNTFYRFA